MTPRTAAPTTPAKERLLESAYELMLAKGYAATSVDEICEKAKLTKGSFFHYFDSKEDLAKALLQNACSKVSPMKPAAEVEQIRDPLERLLKRVDTAIDFACSCDTTRGCLVGTLAQELADTHPAIREICQEAFGLMTERIAHDAEEARLKYAPRRKGLSGRALADHFLAVLEGALILAKANQNPKMVAESLTHYRNYLEGLFKG